MSALVVRVLQLALHPNRPARVLALLHESLGRHGCVVVVCVLCSLSHWIDGDHPCVGRRYAAFEGGLFVRKATELGPNVIDVHSSKDAEGTSPTVRGEDDDSAPRFPIYRVYALPGKITLQWMNSKTVEINNEAVNASATLAEWSHFKETLLYMAENPDIDLLLAEAGDGDADPADEGAAAVASP